MKKQFTLIGKNIYMSFVVHTRHKWAMKYNIAESNSINITKSTKY